MKSFYFILFFSLILFGCVNDKKDGLDGPEAVLIHWQKLVDQGHFAQAETLSTAPTIEWLKEINEIEADSTFVVEFTEIQNISCVIEHDTAFCSYQIIEEGETLDNFTQLVKFKGKWLVDIHDDLDDFMEE